MKSLRLCLQCLPTLLALEVSKFDHQTRTTTIRKNVKFLKLKPPILERVAAPAVEGGGGGFYEVGQQRGCGVLYSKDGSEIVQDMNKYYKIIPRIWILMIYSILIMFY